MRAYIVLLALSVFVLTVSAEDDNSEAIAKSAKKAMECIYKFFTEDPLGIKIVKFAKSWKESMLEARSKVRARLAEYIKTLKSEAD
ncbi:unnamed protein product [Hydatigera taeniaeformis]|uniref:8 kDa glycoprotein n=1 Tax=Hydatigena taeniaeformis TaxID=6205 RepID=A0A0R3X9I0_HYDTA|nr:unnamed protein product [Hydatigera taeniaeformis]